MNLALYRVGYFFREAAKNVRHSALLTVISILTIAVSLILVGFFGGLLTAVATVVDQVSEGVRISAYLTPEIGQSEVNHLVTQIQARDGVETVTYVSIDDDRARNRTLLTEEQLAGLDEQSIPAEPVLEIVLEKSRRLKSDLRDTAEWVKALKGVRSVSDVEVGLDRVRIGIAVVEVFRTLAWAICVVLVVAAVFFVFSTIKLAVHARQDEIEILRLVGATNRFIRVPFYLEGLFQGLAGSLIAFFVVLISHQRLQTYIREEHLVDIQVNLLPPSLVAWFFVGGVLLGLLGSVFSVGRYLRGA